MADVAAGSSAPGGGTAGRGPGVRCRPIEERDLDGVVALLRVGFPERTEAYWRNGLARHAARPLPEHVPRYGYVLDHAGAIVGVILTLYTAVEADGRTHLRCNLSSWYVEPRFRAMATVLDGHAMRDRSVTYLNISAAPHTWAMHEARGFRRYCRGQMLVIPALSRVRRGQRVAALSSQTAAMLAPHERALASDHAGYGCLCLVLSEPGLARVVVLQRRALGFRADRSNGPRVPVLRLIYGPDDLARWLGTLGRYLLLRHAMPWLVIEADGPLSGARGCFFEGRAPKFVRGPRPAGLGDFSYTETVLFGD